MAFSLNNEESWQDYYGAWSVKENGFREWYLDLDIVIEALEKYTPQTFQKSKRILHSGTGTSELPFLLRKAGYERQVGIDFSQSCISSLNALVTTESQSLNFSKMDVKDLDFKDDEFDLIIDKGTLDCVMLNDEKEVGIVSYLKECHRVLKPGGQLAVFSLYGPRDRDVCISCRKRGIELDIVEHGMPEAYETPDSEGGKSHLYVFTKKLNNKLTMDK
eukprot:CAMPEP_0197524116 /NCGR_PEP_ID=MMETSP1318-20131121/8882_1 /TAXON_ID=552666 /ORGANISM="Partenskyella glossopodia, Strain RCC365" /LENGTH=217 /DNA_ID=CAMNT_0043076995 /DNA_START=83 /DNA_END=736 /DNA_ORIENTATION=+